MRIGIDATIFGQKEFTGVSNSIHEVLKVWAEIYPEHEYFLISYQDIYVDFELPSNWHKVIEQWYIPKIRFWWLFERERLIKRLNLDLYWGTSYSMPKPIGKTKYVVSIYDMALFKFSHIGQPETEKGIRKETRLSCNRSDKIIAISDATARDISEILHVDNSKIVRSYCGGLPDGYTIASAAAPDHALLNFPEPFFLFISTIEPRKNVETIVKAFNEYKKRTNDDRKLVIAGRKGWRSESIFETIHNSPYAEDIIVPGYISNNDRAYLLSHASAFVYPSLYEGFGIPVLEAFAYNLPVITTNISSLPEVGGNAAVYIDDAADYIALSRCMYDVINWSAGEHQERNALMQKQLSFFSWKKNAEEIMQIFQRTVEL